MRGTNPILAVLGVAVAAVLLAVLVLDSGDAGATAGSRPKSRARPASSSSRPATAPCSAAPRWSSRSRSRTSGSRPRHFGGEPLLGEGNIRFSLNRVPDCVDPEKLKKADESPIGKGRLVGASFDYPRIRRAQRRARRTDRLDRQLLAGDPAGDLLQRPAARLLPPGRRPSPHNDGSTTPYHDVTNFQILERPGHEIADCVGGKVSSAKAAAFGCRSTSPPASRPILHFV